MPSVEIRKQVTLVEEIFHEGGPMARSPYRRAAVLSVIRNPFAGRYVEEIVGFSDDLKPLGLDMANALIAALGGDPKTIQGYGKGAIVGAAGEIEHGALWHVPGGYAMREARGGAMAIVPSAKKVAGPGARLVRCAARGGEAFFGGLVQRRGIGDALPALLRGKGIAKPMGRADKPRLHGRRRLGRHPGIQSRWIEAVTDQRARHKEEGDLAECQKDLNHKLSETREHFKEQVQTLLDISVRTGDVHEVPAACLEVALQGQLRVVDIRTEVQKVDTLADALEGVRGSWSADECRVRSTGKVLLPVFGACK